MSDYQVIAICCTAVAVTFFGLVALRIWIDHKEAMRPKKCESKSWRESCGTDPCAATRRAIVRAAAEIGKEST